jgi:nuclear pore complex protein Nup62
MQLHCLLYTCSICIIPQIGECVSFTVMFCLPNGCDFMLFCRGFRGLLQPMLHNRMCQKNILQDYCLQEGDEVWFDKLARSIWRKFLSPHIPGRRTEVADVRTCACVYVRMCVCMYVLCMYVCMYKFMCMYVYIYVCTNLCTCMCVCTYVFIYIYVCIYICVCFLCTYVYMFCAIYVCMHTCKHAFKYVVHIHVRMYKLKYASVSILRNDLINVCNACWNV